MEHVDAVQSGRVRAGIPYCGCLGDSHIAAAWAIAILGLGAALIGAYLLLAPEDGRLTIINQTWAVSELRDAWPQVLLICGGAVSFAAMGLALLTQRAMTANYGMAISALVLAGCGAVAVVAGALVAA